MYIKYVSTPAAKTPYAASPCFNGSEHIRSFAMDDCVKTINVFPIFAYITTIGFYWLKLDISCRLSVFSSAVVRKMRELPVIKGKTMHVKPFAKILFYENVYHGFTRLVYVIFFKFFASFPWFHKDNIVQIHLKCASNIHIFCKKKVFCYQCQHGVNQTNQSADYQKLYFVPAFKFSQRKPIEL